MNLAFLRTLYFRGLHTHLASHHIRCIQLLSLLPVEMRSNASDLNAIITAAKIPVQPE